MLRRALGLPKLLAPLQCRVVSGPVTRPTWYRAFSSQGDVFTIVVPSMGDSITEGTIANWVKKVGDSVAVDEVVTTLETDKVSVDVRSPHAGVLTELLAPVQTVVPIGAALAKLKLGAAGAAAPAPAKEAAPAPVKVAAPAPVATPATAPTPAAAPAKAATAPAPAKPAAVVAPAPKVVGARTQRAVPLSPVRIRTNQRLKEVQSTYALLTTFQEIDMSNLIQLRKKYGDEYEKKFGSKLSFLSVFVRAAISALQARPVINAVIDGNDIVYRDYIDVSVSVASASGIVTPVIRNAESLTVGQLDQTIAALANKASTNQLAIEDMVGATFAINNAGVEGLFSQGIVSPPCSVQLNLHGIKERPVAVGDAKDLKKMAVEVHPIMVASLTYDHRIIDGSDSVLFLKHIKQAIEDPARIVLQL